MTGWIKVLITVVILGMTSGCASSRSVVGLDQPADAASNPEQGIAVKIVKVSDARTFESSPKNPDTPSLSGDDINDASLTARALGRKRNGWGMAWGDVLLPDGQTVAGVMKDTLTNGFRNASYRVLTPDDAGYDAAVPVQARVVQFWSWLQPGFWRLTVHNRAEVEISGSLQPLTGGLTVHSSVAEPMMAVTEDDWKDVTSKGLKSFSDNLVRALTGKPQVGE
jgi:hypothetical protein